MMERTHKEERGCNMTHRTDTEILKDLVEAVRTHNALRDEEWDFEESHGDRYMWNAEEMAAHDELLDEIRESTEKVRSLMVEATGDETITF